MQVGNVIRRILGAMCALVALGSSFVAVAFTMPWARDWPLREWFQFGQTDWAWGIRSGAAIVATLAVLTLIAVLAGRTKPVEGMTQTTAYGDVTISLATVESLCLREAMRVRSMHDWTVRVRAGQEGLVIALEATVDGEMAIPTISEQVQKAIKAGVETITGIPVYNVSVRIANVTKSRVALRPTEKQG